MSRQDAFTHLKQNAQEPVKIIPLARQTKAGQPYLGSSTPSPLILYPINPRMNKPRMCALTSLVWHIST